jgi:hypothetical protein
MRGRTDSLTVIVIFVPTVESLRIIFSTKTYFMQCKLNGPGLHSQYHSENSFC